MPELVGALVASVGVAALHGLGGPPLAGRWLVAVLACVVSFAVLGGMSRPIEATAACTVVWSAAACAVALVAPVWPRATRHAIAAAALAAIALGGVLAL